jgi:hypothetical protein
VRHGSFGLSASPPHTPAAVPHRRPSACRSDAHARCAASSEIQPELGDLAILDALFLQLNIRARRRTARLWRDTTSFHAGHRSSPETSTRLATSVSSSCKSPTSRICVPGCCCLTGDRSKDREGQKQAVNGLGAVVSPAIGARPEGAKASNQWCGFGLLLFDLESAMDLPAAARRI